MHVRRSAPWPSILRRRGLQDLNGDFLPPAETAVHIQGMVDRGRKRSPHWPHEAISKSFALSWGPTTVQDGLNNFGSVYGFLAAWFRWGIMSLCLERDSDGTRFWSLGQFMSYFFLLLKVGHEATKDPDLQGFLIVTFVQRYDIAMRSHFHHVVSNRQAFDLNDFLKDTREKTYKEVKIAFLRLESEKKQQKRSSEAISRQSGGSQSVSKSTTIFRGGQSRGFQPPAKQEASAAISASRKPRPTPHSVPTLCRNWEANGTCDYGDQCIFQHSQEKRGVKRSRDEHEPARLAKREPVPR